MLVVAAISAVAISVSLPFVPEIEVSSFELVPQKESLAGLPGQQFRLELRNASSSNCWVPENALPIVVSSGGPISSDPIMLHLGFFREECTQLAPGERVRYDVVFPDGCDQVRLGVFVRDWRGRTGSQHFGSVLLPRGE
ncbi:hypothetical protein FYK55_27610 [Roseiconus nitratireducens]|uniref:Uncharacterized protein n=1 Tax=Roseiconus nitratireducens TaxID=2605748 RepID=A0A5M6CVV6_9BACT|nr:hypothetical protein [Roseiconus nitratireducens]KAA5538510.1 hypothetical protein FYK55_27610 [Roseiconus nitratireducens]